MILSVIKSQDDSVESSTFRLHGQLPHVSFCFTGSDSALGDGLRGREMCCVCSAEALCVSWICTMTRRDVVALRRESNGDIRSREAFFFFFFLT